MSEEMDRSVRVYMMGSESHPKPWTLSYLIPPGDDPRTHDIVWVVSPGVTCRDWDEIGKHVIAGTVGTIEAPANPLATKMYLALMPRDATVERNEQNNARAALVASLQTKDK